MDESTVNDIAANAMNRPSVYVPALVDEITRLRAELAVARSELAVSVGHLSRLAEAYGCENFSAAVDAALAEKGEE